MKAGDLRTIKTTLPPIPRVSRAHVERGDVVVIECPGPMPPAEKQRYIVALRALWPKNPILILDDGKTLKIGTVPPRTRKRR